MAKKKVSENEQSGTLARYHLRIAWWSLLCFLSLGIVLEIMHAFKIGWYLEEAYTVRRLMWTLGHAHGTLLALVHAMFAVTLWVFGDEESRKVRWSSSCLTGASVLLPGGFFLGGIFLYDGDPGWGVFLVPVGASLLFLGVLFVALSLGRRS